MGNHTTKITGDLAVYDGNFRIDWTETKTTTPGKTTINWTLSAVGRENHQDGSLRTTATIQVNGETVWQVNNILQSYRNVVIKTGSFEVFHDKDGKATFQFYVYVTKKYYTGSWSESTSLTVATENYPYSKNYWGNNSSVTINKTYVEPNGNITISWKGAEIGTANSINGYWVEYKLDGESWNKFKDSAGNAIEVASDKKQLDVSIPFNDSKRGKSFKVRVQIISGVSSLYDSDPKESSASYVNSALGELKILNYDGQDKNNIVSSQATNVTINYEKPQKASGQPVIVQLSIEGGGWSNNTEEGCAVVSFDTKKQTLTVQVRATDGVESTSPHVFKFTRNSNQLFSLSAGDWITQKSSGFEFQTNITQIKLSTSAIQNNKGQYTQNVTVAYLERDEDGGLLGSDIKMIQIASGQYDFDIRGVIGTLYAKHKYICGVDFTISDGVDEKKYRVETDWFDVPEIELSGLQDKKHPYFYQDIYCLGSDKWDDNKKQIWKVTQCKYDKEQKEKIDYLYFGSDSNKVYMIKTADGSFVTKIKPLDLDFTNQTYRPYTEQLILNCRSPVDWEPYGLDENEKIELLFSFEKEHSANAIGEESSSDNSLSFSLSLDQSYWVASSFEGATLVSATLNYEYLTIFNSYVKVRSKAIITMDFREPAKNINELNLLINNCTSNKTQEYLQEEDDSEEFVQCPLGEGWVLQEGMEIAIDGFKFKSYVKNPQVVLQYSTDKNNWMPLSPGEVSKPLSVVCTQDKERRNPNHFYVTGSPGFIPEITNNCNIKFRLVITTNTATTATFNYQDGQQFNAKRHVCSLAEFTNVSYEKDGIKADTIVNLQGWGKDDDSAFFTISYKCYIKEEAELISKSGDKYPYPFENKDFVFIAPVIESTLTSTYDSGETKAKFTNTKATPAEYYVYIVCYNTSPTVSYRKNYIGINTNQIDKDNRSVAIISQHGARNKIKLTGTTTTTDTTTDTTTTTMLESSIDLSSMRMGGFVISGGSWDDQKEPNIIGGLTFAPLAYSGDIADLEQKANVVIIINSGSSTELI